jgi:hypothetical protein
MTISLSEPELFGVTESSAAVSFSLRDGERGLDTRAAVRVDGEVRATSEGVAGTRQLRIDGLEPDTAYRIEITAPGLGPVAPSADFPEHFRTLPQPTAREVGSFATLNDLHFGEPRFGGVLLEDGEYGDDQPGFAFVQEGDTDVPYWVTEPSRAQREALHLVTAADHLRERIERYVAGLDLDRRTGAARVEDDLPF